MRHIGFSTGAISRGDFRSALAYLARQAALDSLELSALRLQEVEPLAHAISSLNLSGFGHISFHAPSAYLESEERQLVAALDALVPKSWPIILHPDAIYDHSLWRPLAGRIAIENMDRRKRTGRNVAELSRSFKLLPEAQFCFDIGHARQCDTSMMGSFQMIKEFQTRLAQVHVSEVNSSSQHDPLSWASELAFRSVAHLIPDSVPLIIESRVPPSEIPNEIAKVMSAMPEAASTGLMTLSS